MNFLGGASGKESAFKCRRHERSGFDPWIGKIRWRRGWQPTPVFLPGASPWTEKPGGLLSMGLQRVGHDWLNTCRVLKICRVLFPTYSIKHNLGNAVNITTPFLLFFMTPFLFGGKKKLTNAPYSQQKLNCRLPWARDARKWREKSMWFISVPFYVVGKPTPVPHASPGELLLEVPALLWVLVVLPPDWEIDVGGRKAVSSPSVLCLPPQSTYCCSELPRVANPFSPDFGTAFREQGRVYLLDLTQNQNLQHPLCL